MVKRTVARIAALALIVGSAIVLTAGTATAQDGVVYRPNPNCGTCW